jgi:hypothetical protein
MSADQPQALVLPEAVAGEQACDLGGKGGEALFEPPFVRDIETSPAGRAPGFDPGRRGSTPLGGPHDTVAERRGARYGGSSPPGVSYKR